MFYFFRTEAFHSVSVLVFCPEEVRPGEDNGSSELTECHVKHSVSFLSALSSVTLVPDTDCNCLEILSVSPKL